MFGMIHKSARDMVLEQHGPEAWSRVLTVAGLDDSAMVSAQPYADEVTFKLIGAAAEVAELSLDATLETFGRHWIRASEKGPYANVIRILGGSLLEALMNLDSMHASIQIAMPEARLPQFAVVEHDASSIRMAYTSHRVGLEPFVAGLLEGLVLKFKEAAVVRRGEDVGDSRIFIIERAG